MNTTERMDKLISGWVTKNPQYCGDDAAGTLEGLLDCIPDATFASCVLRLQREYEWEITDLLLKSLDSLWHAVHDEQPATSASYMQVVGQNNRMDDQRFWDAAACAALTGIVSRVINIQGDTDAVAAYADALLAERRKRWA